MINMNIFGRYALSPQYGYGVTITPEDKKQELTAILNDKRVPVTVKHQDTILISRHQ